MLRIDHSRSALMRLRNPVHSSESLKRSRSAVQPVLSVSQKLKPPTRKGTQKLKPKQSKQSSKPSFGTLIKKKIKQGTEIAQSKGADFRPTGTGTSAPLLLARVQQLRLLSKLEKAGLLTLLEKNGVTLTFIERTGLLSKAESLGLLSAAADRKTPGLLYRLAFALYAAGPLLVYVVPDSSTPLVAAQAVAALGCLVGGTAAFGGASLLSALQQDLIA